MKYGESIDHRTNFTTSITELHIKKNKFLRFTALIISIGFLATLFLSAIIYYTKKQILCIKFDTFSPFQPSPILLFACLFGVSIYFITMALGLLKHTDDHFLSIFYIDLSNLYIVMSLLMLGPFLLGIFLAKSYYSIAMTLVMILGALICSFVVFRRIKTKKNITLTTLLSFNIGNSILFSFQVYMVLFCICDLISRSETDLAAHNNIKADLGITICCLYGACAIAILTDFKDIMFPLVYEIFVAGYLFQYDNLFYREIIANIVMATFVFISIIITVYKHGKLTFGYEDDEELIKSLENNNRLSQRT
jgi:hypothetical protein